MGDSDVGVTVDITPLRGDSTGDATVDIADAMFIAQYVVGLRNADFEWIG